jgi:hypothetical protein
MVEHASRFPLPASRFPSPTSFRAPALQLMRFPYTFLLICLTRAAAFAEQPAVHTIAEDGSHRTPGRPAAAPHLLVLGGKPMRVVCKDASATAEIPLSVDRITDTRRIPLTKSHAVASDGEWHWEWTPPATRGIVIYEISPTKNGMARLRIEVRNPEDFNGQLKALKSMAWEAAGLERSESDALSALGLRLRTSRTSGTLATPLLRMVSKDPTQSTRNVTWDQDRHDLVVWRFGPGPGDADIRAPRWWISAEALASDEGRIRFLDLFANSPVSH